MFASVLGKYTRSLHLLKTATCVSCPKAPTCPSQGFDLPLTWLRPVGNQCLFLFCGPVCNDFLFLAIELTLLPFLLLLDFALCRLSMAVKAAKDTWAVGCQVELATTLTDEETVKGEVFAYARKYGVAYFKVRDKSPR